ncbi:MAG: hypothetical protein Terrestrivirus3_55 [Terrestrivirus sp.]|uniref:Uncharacterized protein n=1 Tax=Terrestrivirus sp. TaxID=2487775 RepID=A0A3G4ZLS2_9VIRU|nr:MAG: hypothetical protein Terrestrivirus3_55 [Terrestrivirus sp.]
MSIYLTKEQSNSYNNEVSHLAIEYDKTRDPNVVHKFTAAAFVDRTVHVKFMNGQPVCAVHNNKNLGPVSLSQNTASDYCFEISKQTEFNSFRESHPYFTLEVKYVNDGCVSAFVAKAYDANHNELADFTDYDSW